MNERARPKAFAAAKRPAQVENAPAAAKIGVLLINLGTPDGTSYWPMRRYLKEFLSDRRVIETNRVLWWLILNCRRAGQAAVRQRRQIPLDLERGTRRIAASHHHAEPGGEGGSVARFAQEHRRRLGDALRLAVDRLARRGACRPGLRPAASPSRSIRNMPRDHGDGQRQGLRGAEDAARAAGAAHRAGLSATTPSISRRWRTSIRTHLAGLDFEPEAILASFHGLPQTYVDRGDPYQEQCAATAEALREALGPLGAKLKLTFQSRFGRAEWIKPYTDKTVEALAQDGVEIIAIVTPGFAADCVETLEEIAQGEQGNLPRAWRREIQPTFPV